MKRFISGLFVLFTLMAYAQAQENASGCNTNVDLKCVTTDKSTEGDANMGVVHMGDWVFIDLPEEAGAAGAAKDANERCTKYKFNFTAKGGEISPTPVLYLNHMAIKGLDWTQGTKCNIAFHLTRTEESRDILGTFLSHSSTDATKSKFITVGIGTVQDGFIADVAQMRLLLTSQTKKVIWILCVILLVFATGWLAYKTDLLRDFPKAVPPGDGKTMKLPYSLARVQMAWWFVLTAAAFSAIWLVTGDLSSIPNSILALMGISSATTIMSAVIDTTNADPAAAAQESKGLLKDLLSDNGTISFHRFQMAVWTLLLGVIFIDHAWETISMPDFNTQLLGLMGVASGTYLGFKIPAANKT